MGNGDDPDSDLETAAWIPTQQRPTRRVSAPSILDTVREHPTTTSVLVHTSNNATSKSPTHFRKLPILHLSPQLLRAGCKMNLLRRRSHSLEKFNMGYDKKGQREVLQSNKTYTRSIRKTHSLPPLVTETHFINPSSCERVQRRRGSV